MLIMFFGSLSTLFDFLKLILLLILFVAILVGAYFFTRWYAQSGLLKNKTSNIKVIETFPFGPGKSIHIVLIGKTYMVVAVGKEQITYLGEIKEEDLSLSGMNGENVSFKDVFAKLMENKLSMDKKK